MCGPSRLLGGCKDPFRQSDLQLWEPVRIGVRAPVPRRLALELADRLDNGATGGYIQPASRVSIDGQPLPFQNDVDVRPDGLAHLVARLFDRRIMLRRAGLSRQRFHGTTQRARRHPTSEGFEAGPVAVGVAGLPEVIDLARERLDLLVGEADGIGRGIQRRRLAVRGRVLRRSASMLPDPVPAVLDFGLDLSEAPTGLLRVLGS